MANKRNLTSKTVRTVALGCESPLNYVGVYVYDYSDKRVELTAEVTVGSTTHRHEINLNEEGAKDLAKTLVDKLGLTAEDLGIIPAAEGEAKDHQND